MLSMPGNWISLKKSILSIHNDSWIIKFTFDIFLLLPEVREYFRAFSVSSKKIHERLKHKINKLNFYATVSVPYWRWLHAPSCCCLKKLNQRGVFPISSQFNESMTETPLNRLVIESKLNGKWISREIFHSFINEIAVRLLRVFPKGARRFN